MLLACLQTLLFGSLPRGGAASIHSHGAFGLHVHLWESGEGSLPAEHEEHHSAPEAAGSTSGEADGTLDHAAGTLAEYEGEYPQNAPSRPTGFLLKIPDFVCSAPRVRSIPALVWLRLPTAELLWVQVPVCTEPFLRPMASLRRRPPSSVASGLAAILRTSHAILV
ncbi:MAG: hypothetical protein JNJ88_11565 [Planctomycetes bacterium]|nr:hypothetical protein [Planctomycetota bacterium]